MDAIAKERGPRKAAMAFIFAVLLLDVIALGIIIPVLPKLIETMLGGDTAHAAAIFGLFATAWALMQFLFSPVLGALSDRYGRRPVLLLSMVGHGLDYILMALAPTLAWLFLGRVISGITAASFATAHAYVADVTAWDKRAAAFGLLGAAFGIGFVVGPALGGILGNWDPRLPFWVAAAFCLANAAYGWFVLPESLPPEKRMGFAWKRASPLGALRLLGRQPRLLGLGGVVFLDGLAHMVLPAVAVLYATHRYGWDLMTMGLTIAAVGVATGIVQAGVVKPAVGWLGERTTLIVGLLFGIAGFSIYGLATTPIGFWAGIPVMAFWGLANAALMAIMSRLVGPSEQGQLQGANASLTALAGLIGPLLFSLVFARAISPESGWNIPGAPFLLAAALLVVAIGLAWWVTSEPARPDAAAADTPSTSPL